MTPIFEKINFLGFCRIFGLKTVPAAWPGPGPPIPIFKKFSEKIPKKFFLIFWMLSLFDVIFHKDDPGKWPLKWLFLNRMLRLDFWPENQASRLARTWASFTIFLNYQKNFFFQNFCFFRRFRPKFTPPYAFPAKKSILGEKTFYSVKEGVRRR